MIVGITCTVIVGAIALWQALVARAYKSAAETYRDACEVARTALERQRREAQIMQRRLECICAALPLHHAAAVRGDARQCNAILATAIAAGNAIVAGDA